MAIQRLFIPILAAMVMVASSGCDKSGIEKIVVSGKVTYQGQPVKNGDLLFYPIDGTAGPVSGSSIKDGEYLADGKGGVPIGKHRVEIRGYRSAAPSSSMASKDIEHAERRGGQREQYLPAQFNSGSTLVVEVGTGTQSKHDFKLTE